MLSNAEHILLTVFAFGIVGVFLVAIADTPAYPIAVGLEVIALFILMMEHGTDIATKLQHGMQLGGLQT